MTDRLFFAAPIARPEDIIPYLAKQERHWKKGYSAYELAYSWVGAKGIPDPVVAVLHQAEEFRGMELIEGFFEKETDLRSRGRPSQTDLLALIGDGEGFAVLGVEGKVDEPFGPLVSEWLVDASANKRARLLVLQGTLGLAGHNVSNLRYQLLHRTAAAIYEAQRYKVRRAVMLGTRSPKIIAGSTIFGRSPTPSAHLSPARMSFPRRSRLKVSLRLGWVADEVLP